MVVISVLPVSFFPLVWTENILSDLPDNSRFRASRTFAMLVVVFVRVFGGVLALVASVQQQVL